MALPLTSKRRAELRAQAHHLQSMVHVGQQGLTPSLLESLDDALRTHELVKVQVSRQADVVARAAAEHLASTLHADVIQVIGRTTTLYRKNPDLPRKEPES